MTGLPHRGARTRRPSEVEAERAAAALGEGFMIVVGGPDRCPSCDSMLADPKAGWPECADPWHEQVSSDEAPS